MLSESSSQLWERAAPRLTNPTALNVLLVAALASACGSRSGAIGAAKSPEQVVFARSSDDVVSGGLMFSPPRDSAKRLAIIWIHGWGVNFYQPSYVAIGRALAEHGYTVIDGNTRMHDLGNVESEHGGKRVRGGGYWGVASDERVRVPLLAFFGTVDDVGGRADLDTIVAATTRHQGSAARVTTALIDGGDHMYTGREQLVAQVIARWAARLVQNP